MATTVVSDMVLLVNEGFQCVVVYNLDIRKTYDQVLNLLCLWRRFPILEAALEKLPPSRSVVPGLEVLEGLIYSLEDITREVVDHFSHVSRITDGTKFTM